jgi:hypothetical protein
LVTTESQAFAQGPASTDTAAPAAERPDDVAPAPAVAPRKDTSQKAMTKEDEEKESKNHFRNTTLLFDQSASTQTARLSTAQSYIPSYDWWVSFRPRYWFNENVYVSARFDYYKEFTNAQTTTYYREDVFGDIWTDAVYTTKLPFSKNTRVSGGARFKFPTSKESYDQGIYLHAGVTGSVKQTFPLLGESAKALNDAHLGLSLWYDHPFSRATTPTNPGLDYVRADTDLRSFQSDQLTGGTLVKHGLTTVFDSGLQITPKLALTVDMIFVNNWHYSPTATNVTVQGQQKTLDIGSSAQNTTYTVTTWFLASLDYDLVDELSLDLGYYNLTGEIAPDGVRRGIFSSDNVFWSPDGARVFLGITGNLDKIYEWASGQKAKNASARANANTTGM